jgi:nucleoside-diphosphate kinase
MIQAAHRGRAARRDTAARAATAGLVSGAMDSIFQTDAEENAAAAIVQASYRGHKTRMDLKRAKELEDEEATAAAILEGTEEETAAAIKIQAVHRGRAARADAAIRAAGSGLVAGALGAVVDAEENEAATKLQCSFRGHQDRKRVAAMRAAAAGDGEEDA